MDRDALTNPAPPVRPPWRRGVLILAALLVAAPTSGEGPDSAQVVERVRQGLRTLRRERGLPGLDRRRALEAVAQGRAEGIALRPEAQRLQQEEPIETLLEHGGVGRYHRARERIDLQQGYRDPAAAVLERWNEAAGARELILDPAVDAVGLGAARAGDGWLVFVAIFLQDLDLPPDLTVWEREVAEAVNRIRSRRNLALLSFSSVLAGVARSHSRDMATRSFFSHQSPEGRSVSDRVRSRGLEFRQLAENIARNKGVDDPLEVAVKGWMDSRSHRANILEPAFRETGVGIAVDGEGIFFFTQVFFRGAQGG